jgi:phosphinothricin acetyltransferase
MNIRLTTRDDIIAILGISNWAAANTPANFAVKPEELNSWLKSYDETHRKFPWLVAVGDSGDVIGFARSSPHKGRCAYAWTAEVSVYVHPEHHGRGVGKSLYEHLIPMLREQGYVTLIAGITTPNPASERLHAGCGFVRIGAFERVGWKFNKWHDVSYWQMMLADERMPPSEIKPVADVSVMAAP